MCLFFRKSLSCHGNTSRFHQRIPRQIFLAALFFILLPSVYADVNYYSLSDVELVAVHEHTTASFTEGYFFKDDVICETGGYWYESAFYQDNKVAFKLGATIFAEGSVILNDKLFILTYQNKLAFIYDPTTFKQKNIVQYNREGWGLTTDGSYLIASDGSSKLYFMDSSYRLKKTLAVKEKGRSVSRINELEYIDGFIWANVFLTDDIIVIDAKSGEVRARIDLSELYPSEERNEKADVMNGIAWKADSKTLWLTGKYWDKAFELDVSDIMKELQ